MRRLDQALVELAERGDPIGPDLMADRIDRHLAGETDAVVVALDPRRTTMQTRERTTDTRQTGRRRGFAIAIAAFAAVLVVGAVGLLVGANIGSDDAADPSPPPPATPTTVATVEPTTAPAPPVAGQDLVDALVAAFREGDAAAIGELVVVDPFVPWLIAIDASTLEFTDCTNPAPELIQCETKLDGNHFYAQLLGEPHISVFTATVGEQRLSDQTWPPGDGVEEAEARFEAWATEAHPELAPVLFNPASPVANIRFSQASGETRMALLDEYLEYLGSR